MRIVTANPTGLCFGVRRAIEELEAALRQAGTVYALGSPIHNPQEISRLEGLGLVVTENPEEIPDGAVVFVRAHGVGPKVLADLQRRAVRVVDGTCPFVRSAQERAGRLSSEGYVVLLVGDRDHPEVRGIRGYVEGEAFVCHGVEDLPPDRVFDKVGVVCQTTQREATLGAVVGALVPRARELRVFNTICRATVERQESIRRLAEEVRHIVVIGGRNSANTRKLVEIARNAGADVQSIEHAGELDGGWLADKDRIGVAAGASTPDWLIHQLISILATPRSSRGTDGNDGDSRGNGKPGNVWCGAGRTGR